ncbi:MAG: hypothetical protein K2X91_10630, partial [Thermoleophilia bacterium]|nr:hypothetical protein [Thermoleophilia bacterium]
FSPDSSRALIGSADGYVDLWSVPADPAAGVEHALDLVRLTGPSRAADAAAPVDSEKVYRERRIARPERFAIPAETERGWHLQAALQAAARGHHAAALPHVERLLELGPATVALRHDRAECRLATGKWEEAAADFTELLVVLPFRAQARFGRGAALTLLGKTADAKDDFSAAARADSAKPPRQFIDALYAKAVLHARDGELPGYRRALGELAAGAPRFVGNRGYNAFIRLATLLPLDAAGDKDALVKMSEAHAEAAQREFNAVLALGSALYRTGNDERAIGELTKAIREWEARGMKPPARPLDPSFPQAGPLDVAEAHLFLAMAQFRAGKAAAAKESLDKAWLMVQETLGPYAADGPPAPAMSITNWLARARVNVLYKEAKALVEGEGKK